MTHFFSFLNFFFRFFLEKIIFFQQKIKIFQNQDLSKYIVQLSVLINDHFFFAGLEGKRHVPSFFLFDFVPKYKVYKDSALWTSILNSIETSVFASAPSSASLCDLRRRTNARCHAAMTASKVFFGWGGALRFPSWYYRSPRVKKVGSKF